MIAAEDTRNTKKLCNYFDIQTPLISYHEHNIEVGGEKLLGYLQEGKSVALVSDAGLPCISDPGADIVVKAIAEEFACRTDSWSKCSVNCFNCIRYFSAAILFLRLFKTKQKRTQRTAGKIGKERRDDDFL